jgi:hypothetical protein
MHAAYPPHGESHTGEGCGDMITSFLHAAGLRSDHLHALSFGGVGLCIVLWIRAKTVDQDERGNAERRALFVGLGPPTLWLVGDSLDRRERHRRRR